MAVFNLSQIHLEDVGYFCDKKLDNINVYSVVLVSNSVDFDLIITDFLQSMKMLSCVEIIQQIAVDFSRFTFVSDIECSTFAQCLQSIVDKLSHYYNCKISIL